MAEEEPASVGLRARARRLRRERQAPVGLGDEQSQAYFTAKRFRSSRCKPAVRKPAAASRKRKKQQKGDSGEEEDEDEEKQEQEEEDDEEEDDEKLVLPPQGDMLASLQRVDEGESALRDGAANWHFPRFDHVREKFVGCKHVGVHQLTATVYTSALRCGRVSCARATACC
jgi:hypothetical protein